MRTLIAYLISFYLLMMVSAAGAIPREKSIDDLLVPEIQDKSNLTNNQNNKVVEDSDIDSLIGPEDIFPFLPDNHRDSGTGKFNAY